MLKKQKITTSNFKILKTHTYKYDETWKNYLRNAIKLNNEEIKKLNIEFSLLISKYVNQFSIDFSTPKIELNSSHGHTIFHEPEKGITLQIGDGNIISQKTSSKVVCDFRSQDVNLGGQAPQRYGQIYSQFRQGFLAQGPSANSRQRQVEG